MPKIEVKCKNCGHQYKVGDLLPPSKSICPMCSKKELERIRKGITEEQIERFQQWFEYKYYGKKL